MNRKNSVIIKDGSVIKKRNDRVLELYDYLDTRGFNNYPKVISSDSDIIESEYINETKYHEITKGVELIKTVADLHYKTLFFKEVSKNKYRTIYDKLSGNIEYLKEYYENMISSIEEEVFMSPSHYLFARNYTIIDSSLKYALKSLKIWFKKVEGKSKERVCVIHNNLSFDHFIKGDKNYLISFDNSLVDTPILDLYTFYRKEGFKIDFKYLIGIYEEKIKLLDEEKLLLNVLISIPPKIIEVNDEYLNTLNIKNTFNYMYSSMLFVNQNK